MQRRDTQRRWLSLAITCSCNLTPLRYIDSVLRPKRLALGCPRCDDQRACTHTPAIFFHRLNTVDCAVEQYLSVRAHGGSIRRVSATLVRLECCARAPQLRPPTLRTHTPILPQNALKKRVSTVYQHLTPSASLRKPYRRRNTVRAWRPALALESTRSPPPSPRTSTIEREHRRTLS
jgi:hypothetical protein